MNWLTDLLNISSKKHRKDVSGPDPRMSVVSTDSDNDSFNKSRNKEERLKNAKNTKFADKVREEKNNNKSTGMGK